jgi:hypothetical protein
VSSRKRRRKRVGVGSRGKYPGAPPHHIKKMKNEKNKPTAKVPDRPSGERGKAIKKTTKNTNLNIIIGDRLITEFKI